MESDCDHQERRADHPDRGTGRDRLHPLFDACVNRLDEFSNPCNRALLEALGTALLGGAFASYLLADADAPGTIKHMWQVWAPIVVKEARHYGRMPVPRQYAGQGGEPDE